MSLADELIKLDELRRQGVLSDTEFALAKQKLLEGNSPPANSSSNLDRHLTDQLAEMQFSNDLAALDRAWDIEKQNYCIASKYGVRQIPTNGMGNGMMFGGAGFGLIWTIMAFSITSGAPDFGPFSVARVIFPLFGVGFIVGAIFYGLYIKKKASEYQAGYERYQKRRRELTGEPI